MHCSRQLLVALLIASATGCGQKLNPGGPAEAQEPAASAEPTDTATATTPIAANPCDTVTATPVATQPNAVAATPNSTTVTTPTTPAANVCGTTSPTIGYAAFAGKVVLSGCGGNQCHNPGTAAGISLVDYASAKSGLIGGGLNAINQGSMPRGRTLSPNDKCVLTTWAAGNYLP